MTSSPYTDAELIALAKAATPGPWYADGGVVCEIIIHGSNAFDEEPTAELSKLADTNESDAAFIAAFNPETVLSLLEQKAALEAQNKELREALKPFGEYYRNAWPEATALQDSILIEDESDRTIASLGAFRRAAKAGVG